MPEPARPTIDSVALELRDALAVVLADQLRRSRSARDFARLTGLDKSIGWKLWRMSTAPSAVALLRVFPRSRGVRVMLDAVRRHAQPPRRAEEVERLAMELARLRASAEHEAVALGHEPIRQAASKASIIARLARGFDEATEVAGCSLELRIGAFILVPHDDAKAGVAACTLVDGPRCYRSGVRATVYVPLTSWSGRSPAPRPGGEATCVDEIPGFMPDLSTAGIDASQFAAFRRNESSVIHEWAFLPRPGVPESLSFLEVSPRAGDIWAAEPHDFGSLSMGITAPMRRAVLDIWVHQSMPTPDFTVSLRKVKAVMPHPGAPSSLLPSPFPDGVLLECRSSGLGPAMKEVSTRYGALLERGAAALGSELGALRHYRVSVRHPPLGSFVVVDWPLPTR